MTQVWLMSFQDGQQLNALFWPGTHNSFVRCGNGPLEAESIAVVMEHDVPWAWVRYNSGSCMKYNLNHCGAVEPTPILIKET